MDVSQKKIKKKKTSFNAKLTSKVAEVRSPKDREKLITSPLIILRTYFRSMSKSIFRIVVMVAVQGVFCLEMHKNKFFLFFKNYF
jgi:hypothetical protein